MKNMLAIIMLVLVTGCGWPKKPSPPAAQCADIPIYTKPNFDIPPKPELRSNGASSAGDVVRDTELDVLDLQTYATKLETLLKKFK